jgi:hypothetical protein
MIDQNTLERAALWNSLTQLGNQVKTKWCIDPYKVEKELEQFKENWCPYNIKKDSKNNRWGLPVTSHTGDVMDNYHLNSFGYMQKYHDVDMKEENFTTPTAVYNTISDIAKLVDVFAPDIGRVHLLRIDQGGFFPPHRDYQGIAPEYFRLLCVFGRCSPENYVQMVDGKPLYPEAGWVYFTNFQLDHSVFSFSDNLYSLILTVKLNERTHGLIMKNLMNT